MRWLRLLRRRRSGAVQPVRCMCTQVAVDCAALFGAERMDRFEHQVVQIAPKCPPLTEDEFFITAQ